MAAWLGYIQMVQTYSHSRRPKWVAELILIARQRKRLQRQVAQGVNGIIIHLQ